MGTARVMCADPVPGKIMVIATILIFPVVADMAVEALRVGESTQWVPPVMVPVKPSLTKFQARRSWWSRADSPSSLDILDMTAN